MEKEDQIRLIAFSIWEEEGRQDGHDLEHWLRAESMWGETQKEEPVPKQLNAVPGRVSHKAKRTKKKH